jgi:two-component system phosphate regulon response regulator PhoB
MSTHETILIVDDEDDLRKVLDFNLRNSGFETLLAANGQEAIDLAKAHHPDLILLDIMLPDMQGTKVCQELKTDTATRDIPVVMVSARGEEIDRVVGFELGADDYVTKPFSVREVVLRVRAILKRVGPDDEIDVPEDTIDFGALELDRARHRVWLAQEEVKLTATEFRLLETFLTRRGRVQTRDALLKDVWGEDINVTPRTVDTHVKRLREKLGDSGTYIETVRGVGYRFAESP